MFKYSTDEKEIEVQFKGVDIYEGFAASVLVPNLSLKTQNHLILHKQYCTLAMEFNIQLN